MRVQRSSEHRLMPWANGRGVTAEICAVAHARGDWAWRLSIADVADDGPFSVLPGVDRHIAVVHGVGMGLTVAGEAETDVRFGSAAFSFTGDATTTCRLLNGPVLDLNLMVRRSSGVGALLIEHVPAGYSLDPDNLVGSYSPATAAVVVHGVVQGLVHGDLSSLTPFDTLLVDPGERLPYLVAEVDSIIALVTLQLNSAA